MTSNPQLKASVIEPERKSLRGVGVAGRIARLAFGLLFQLATVLVLFFAVHLVRGSYETSVYNNAQQLVGGLLGFPCAALCVGVLVAAIYTAATGKQSALTFKLAGAAVGLFVVMYALELALK
jgi:hypothetical protein